MTINKTVTRWVVCFLLVTLGWSVLQAALEESRDYPARVIGGAIGTFLIVAGIRAVLGQTIPVPKLPVRLFGQVGSRRSQNMVEEGRMVDGKA